MIKYRLYRESFEFRANSVGHKAVDENGDSYDEITPQEVQDAYLELMSCDPQLIAEFDSEEEANAAMADEPVGTYTQSGNNCLLVMGSLAYIQMEDLDEDGEFVQAIEMWFKAEGCRW